jgi:hypothetical protein
MLTSHLRTGAGNVLIYVQSTMKRPQTHEFPSVYQYHRAYGEYNGTQRFYTIKKEDAEAILEQIKPEYLKGLETENGVNIPFENMEIYTDKIDGKKYARLIGGKKVFEQDGTAPTQTPEVPTQQHSVAKAVVPILEVKENRLFFEIQVDETNGEPMLQFTYEGKTETMEEKILKSFVIKALNSGVDIENAKNNLYQIKISKK